MKLLLLTATLLLLAEVNSFTILDPISGRVKTDLSEAAKNNDVYEALEGRNESGDIKVISQEPTTKRFDAAEYLDSNKQPVYKQIRKSPYGKRK